MSSDDANNSTSSAPPTTVYPAYPVLSLMLTLVGMVVPLAMAWYWWQKKEKEFATLDDILETDSAAKEEEDDPLESIKAAPWPRELPGLPAIIAYEDLKDDILDAMDADEDVATEILKPEDRTKLRHALMDRCQSHVAWLLRLEREQRSMERMSRRGMISANDYATFSTFAERLDVEVSQVREEAAWLCDEHSKSRQAADEIWRIAVQIWQQRRQAAALANVNNSAENNSTDAKKENDKDKEKAEALKAKVRAQQAKKSLKGLKGGFLDAGDAATDKKKKQNGVVKSSTTKKKKEEEGKQFQASAWPEKLPNLRHREGYEKMKQTLLASGDVEDAKKKLRQVLMERCQALVPLLRALDSETERYKNAVDGAKWTGGVGAPSAEDWGRLEKISRLADEEKKTVEEEAEWLEESLGDQIWPLAFSIYNKFRSESEKAQKQVTEKVVAKYQNQTAKPWPKSLPGAKHRDEYERMKASLLASLPPQARTAVLEGRPAPHVVGPQNARQLRQALMARCQQTVPIIQRLQQEARGVHVAAERGLVSDEDLDAFNAIDDALKREVENVKIEAEWLADDAGTRKGMGEQVWPAAFQIYAKRRAEIAKNLQLATNSQISSSQEEDKSPAS